LARPPADIRPRADNNYCGLQVFGQTNWNFATWDKWAKTAPNPAVKLFIGAPAASAAAGSGFVGLTELTIAATATAGKYASFGGVMLWEASVAYGTSLSGGCGRSGR
jgi:chitinase